MPLHRGKIATNPEVLEVRPLTREDLAILTEPRGPQRDRAGSGAIAKLREPHHRLARMIAAGLRMHELVERSGYSAQRISTLQKNAAFQEVIAGYRGKVDEAFLRKQEAAVELMTANAITAERMIMEQLEIAEEEGKLPPIRDLLAIRSDSYDRIGYGKRNMNVNVNVDFAARMEAAAQRSRTVRQIEARPVPHPPGPTSTSEENGVPALASPPMAPFQRRA